MFIINFFIVSISIWNIMKLWIKPNIRILKFFFYFIPPGYEDNLHVSILLPSKSYNELYNMGFQVSKAFNQFAYMVSSLHFPKKDKQTQKKTILIKSVLVEHTTIPFFRKISLFSLKFHNYLLNFKFFPEISNF